MGKLPGNALKDPTEAARNALRSNYRYRAGTRKLTFDLSKEEFLMLTSDACHYCGALPKQILRIKGTQAPYIYNGVDRKDNLIGYNLDNCVTACKKCNILKRAWSYSDFIEHVNIVAKRNPR